MLEGYRDREIETPVDSVGECYIVEVDIIDHLGALSGALLLLFGSDEVTMRKLFPKAKRKLPPPLIQNPTVVGTGAFTACALHANHGRALTSGNSTLRPGMLSGRQKAE